MLVGSGVIGDDEGEGAQDRRADTARMVGLARVVAVDPAGNRGVAWRL